MRETAFSTTIALLRDATDGFTAKTGVSQYIFSTSGKHPRRCIWSFCSGSKLAFAHSLTKIIRENAALTT